MMLKFNQRFLYSAVAVCMLISSCRKAGELTPVNAVAGSSANARAAVGSPNIILVIADDMGYEVPTYLGGQSYSTPNLDNLARNGVQFNQAYCHPDGFPSRLAIYTGKYNFRNYFVWGILPEGEKTIGNMLQDAGYATCFTGKWQNGGGDTAIRGAGFDKYLTYLPFGQTEGEDQRTGRYKSPHLYENADYLPDAATAGKYSEDMYVDYISNFIDSNLTNPFFVVYANNLVAKPYVPTPDDAEYAAWDPPVDDLRSSKRYYPSMVKYMDKKIGQLVQKVKDAGLEQNTVIIFTCDNATERTVSSVFRGRTVNGGKTTTTRNGTAIPFLAYWPGTIAPRQKSQSLVDFTDILPTMADIAGIPSPVTYGTLDGISFYDNMTGTAGTNRTSVFCHWDNNFFDGDVTPLERFVNNQTYKLYDVISTERGGNFYNIAKDVYETRPIPDAQLTPAEQQVKASFQAVIATMHN